MKRFNLLYSEKGTSVVMFAIAALFIAACASIAIDIGLAIREKTNLVNAADSAALAGAQELLNSREAAINTAKTYLNKNDVSEEEANVLISENGDTISVFIGRKIKFAFARLLGFGQDEMKAGAVVKAMPVTELFSGVRPFAVENQTLRFGQQYVLKEGAGDGNSGNYGALALGGTGADRFKENIIHGYQHSLKVGDLIDTEPGNMKGPSESGVRELISSCDHFPKCTYSAYELDCQRVISVVVVDSLDVHGRKPVEIVGFASLFLEDVETDGGHTEITGRFIKNLIRGGLSDHQTDYGLWSTKLIK